MNIAHNTNSHLDYRLPLYLRDQVIYLPEEVLYKLKLVSKVEDDQVMASRENSLSFDLCINKVVKCDGQLDRVFINDIRGWVKMVKQLQDQLNSYCTVKRELTEQEVEMEKQRILNANRAHAKRSEFEKEQDAEKKLEHMNSVWEKAGVKPEKVAMGGPEPVDPRKRKADEENLREPSSKSSR